MSPWFYLPAACVFVIMSKWPLLRAMVKHGNGKYDNNTPREQQAALGGWGARARAAHYNTIEAFPPFAAGFLAAQLGGGDTTWIHILCCTWFASRTIYIWAYLKDTATFRTLVWAMGLGASIWLMLLPAL